MIEINDIKNIRRDKVFINGNFDFSKLSNITKINCGAFGCVYKINNVSKHICIKLSKISNKNFSNIFNENDLGKKLNNFIPNIYETGVSIINKTKYYYTIMDFIDGDEIDNYEFNNQQIIELFIFLIKFMYILHKNNLAYTDIKPQNIMYDGNNNGVAGAQWCSIHYGFPSRGTSHLEYQPAIRYPPRDPSCRYRCPSARDSARI